MNKTERTDERLGRVAYDTMGRQPGRPARLGLSWEALLPAVRLAWSETARAVREAVEERIEEVTP